MLMKSKDKGRKEQKKAKKVDKPATKESKIKKTNPYLNKYFKMD